MKMLDSSKWFIKNRLSPLNIYLFIDACQCLTEREKTILKAYCLTSTPVEDIGESLGYTQARILQIAHKAIQKTNRELKAYEKLLKENDQIRRENDLLSYKVKKLEASLIEANKPVPTVAEIDALTIEDIDVSVRTYNALKAARINTVGDLKGWGTNMIGLRNFGKKSFIEIEEVMEHLGIKWPVDNQ